MKKLYLWFILAFSLYANDGLTLFRQECLMCHGKTSFIIKPSDKASIQWERFLNKNRHTPMLNLSQPMKEKLKCFLIEHSADSDYPTVPGLY